MLAVCVFRVLILFKQNLYYNKKMFFYRNYTDIIKFEADHIFFMSGKDTAEQRCPEES